MSRVGKFLPAQVSTHLVLAASTMIACLGCGGSSGSVAHVQGKVTIAKKDIPSDAEAYIMFTPTKPGSKGVSVPIAGGAYDSPKTPTGPVRVSFQITRPTGPVKKSERTGGEYRDTENLVPMSKANGVDITVDGDKSDQNFAL